MLLQLFVKFTFWGIFQDQIDARFIVKITKQFEYVRVPNDKKKKKISRVKSSSVQVITAKNFTFSS